jgi:hypothetical protein
MTAVYSLFPIINNSVPHVCGFYENNEDDYHLRNPQHYSQYKIWDISNENLDLHRHVALDQNYTHDLVMRNCYQNMIKVDLFFKDHFRKWPVKNDGHIIRVCLNHPNPTFRNNAYWDPVNECVCFGQVDTRYFRPLASNLDVLAHELGHAAAYYSSKLRYSHQGGALNESIADIFAIMVKHYQSKSHANDPNTSWKYGEGLLLHATGGDSWRSLKDPEGAYYFHPILQYNQQVSHMNRYQNVNYDNGGIHANSGIPNKAFYLASSDVGGFCWERIGNTWHTALINSGKEDGFEDFACRTMSAAKKLHYGPHVQQSIGNAWLAVGVDLRKHSYKIYDVPPAANVLEKSIQSFSNHDYYNGMRYFYEASARECVTSSAVYKNTWEIKGKPRDVFLEYGRYSFHDEHGYNSTYEQKTEALKKFKQALIDYETLQYIPPSFAFEFKWYCSKCCDVFRRLFRMPVSRAAL